MRNGTNTDLEAMSNDINGKTNIEQDKMEDSLRAMETKIIADIDHF
jgi:hypothetical protein